MAEVVGPGVPEAGGLGGGMVDALAPVAPVVWLPAITVGGGEDERVRLGGAGNQAPA